MRAAGVLEQKDGQQAVSWDSLDGHDEVGLHAKPVASLLVLVCSKERLERRRFVAHRKSSSEVVVCAKNAQGAHGCLR